MGTEEHQCLEQECKHTCVCSMHVTLPEQNFWAQDISRFTGLPICTIPTWCCLCECLYVILLRSMTWLLWMCHSRAGRGWFVPGHGPLELTETTFSCRDGREILHKDHATLEIKENTDLFFMLLSIVIFMFSTSKDIFFCVFISKFKNKTNKETLVPYYIFLVFSFLFCTCVWIFFRLYWRNSWKA